MHRTATTRKKDENKKISLLSSKMMAATMCIWYFPSSHVQTRSSRSLYPKQREKNILLWNCLSSESYGVVVYTHFLEVVPPFMTVISKNLYSGLVQKTFSLFPLVSSPETKAEQKVIFKLCEELRYTAAITREKKQNKMQKSQQFFHSPQTPSFSQLQLHCAEVC